MPGPFAKASKPGTNPELRGGVVYLGRPLLPPVLLFDQAGSPFAARSTPFDPTRRTGSKEETSGKA